jgi:hypothetical protein
VTADQTGISVSLGNDFYHNIEKRNGRFKVRLCSFSVDFSQITDEHKTILRGWLQIYDELKYLQFDAWLQPMTNTLDSWSRHNAEIGFAAAVYGARELFIQGCRKQYLLNATNRDNIICCVNKTITGNMTIFSPSHVVLQAYETTVIDTIKVNIPTGGYAVFEVK